MNTRTDIATTRFLSGYNCAQAVLNAFRDETGLNEDLALKIATGLGAGMGRKQEVTPMSRGAGVLMSLVRADGFIRIPAMSEGIGSGAEVHVELLRSKHDIGNTIVCIVSHDNALDLLANVLKKRYPKYSLSSAHVGSMGGLVALKRAEGHIAGIHLLDEETGEYNIPFIQRLLPERKILLVNLVYREQGLLVPKGNQRILWGLRTSQGTTLFLSTGRQVRVRGFLRINA